MKDFIHTKLARAAQNINKTIESKLWYSSEHSGLVLPSPDTISKVFPDSQKHSAAKLSDEFTNRYGFPIYSRIFKSTNYEEKVGFLCNHGCYIGAPLIEINMQALEITDKNLLLLYFKCPLDGVDLRELYSHITEHHDQNKKI